jgi:hypothetical protein
VVWRAATRIAPERKETRMPRAKKVECPKCGQAKSPADFYPWSKQGGNTEGRSHHCRACEAERQRARRPAKKKQIS